MKLRLKEEPKEWLKFTAVIAVIPAVIAFTLYRRHHLDRVQLLGVGVFLLAAIGLAALRPHWFRGFYRAGMTLSYHIGQFMGRVLLTVFFLCLLTPLGLLLRLFGKDLLAMRKPAPGRLPSTYWRSARPWGPLDRQF